MDGRLQIFAGTSHPQLAAEIMGALEAPLGRAEVGSAHRLNGEDVGAADVFLELDPGLAVAPQADFGSAKRSL